MKHVSSSHITTKRKTELTTLLRCRETHELAVVVIEVFIHAPRNITCCERPFEMCEPGKLPRKQQLPLAYLPRVRHCASILRLTDEETHVNRFAGEVLAFHIVIDL